MTKVKSKNKTATDANTVLADSIISFETFRKIGSYEQSNLQSKDASCFNGVVNIRKYKVTIEPIEEPKEILAERLQKLWDECDNWHHWTPLSAVFLHHKIEMLIPFISEEFITYPLWEEGKYIPFLKCWQKADTENKCTRLSNKLNKHFEKTGYEISFVGKEHRSVIHEFYVYPKWKELKNGSYKFVKKDWSIEEMLELLGSVLK